MFTVMDKVSQWTGIKVHAHIQVGMHESTELEWHQFQQEGEMNLNKAIRSRIYYLSFHSSQHEFP